MSAEGDGRAGRLLRALLALLIVAGIVHLGGVLVLSRRDGASAYARVLALGGGTPLRTFAGPPAGTAPFPWRDPAMATAFCLFDLRAGPVAVSLPVTPLDVAILSVHDGRGQAVYALTNRSAVRGMLDVSVMTPAMIAAQGEAGGEGVRVPLDGETGFVMVQALVAMSSLRKSAEEASLKLTCRALPAR